jgi:cytochrome c
MKKTLFLLCLAPLFFSLSVLKRNNEGQAPEENRFKLAVLSDALSDPTDMAILPNGNILITELYGGIKLYNAQTKKTKKINAINVARAPESGLMTIALDPDFEKNKWIYLVYSPAAQKVNYLSRIAWTGDSLDFATEKVLLRIPDERACCHAGSGICFDTKGNLFITVGDNTNPFATNYAPIDDRPGRQNFDAQRTSANTKDLRGKVLRIHPERDGSYTIPAGNLFSDTTEGRPEIFAMGCRNPYRITVDKRTDIPYWGEVGPDASDGSSRGPRGYDELNQGIKAGNYGWPYFIGDNEGYAKVDFATDAVGAINDPSAPVNKSRNNTGAEKLPPVIKPLVWYPYDRSEFFPNLGSGGRTLIAGQFFYANGTNGAISFPSYYNNGLFIADWMRNWIKVVRLKEDGALDKVEDFMPSTSFRKPISLKFGGDGALYVLEFGSLWGGNKDSRLVRVEYNKGNRPPVAKAGASQAAGALPLKVQFSSEGSFDYDKEDRLVYEWIFDGRTVQSSSPDPVYVFQRPGTYKVRLRVKDKEGLWDTAFVVIRAGNSMPELKLDVNNKGSFYMGDINYAVQVSDKEDGSTTDRSINPAKVKVSMDYFPEGKITTTAARVANPFEKGSTWINESDCKGCHAMKAKSIGPSFTAVAERYKNVTNRPALINRLGAKIITGGKGVWGEHAMNPHPQLSKETTTEIVKYILSLAKSSANQKILPLKGRINTDGKNEGTYVISASYTDRGRKGAVPLTGMEKRVLRSPLIKAADFDAVYELRKTDVLTSVNKNAYALLKSVDLTGIKEMQFSVATETKGTSIEVHTDSPDGTLVARTDVPVGKWSEWQTVKAELKPITGEHDIYIVFKNREFVLSLLSLKSIRLQ